MRYTLQPSAAPAWWGKLPWEDVMLGALLQVGLGGGMVLGSYLGRDWAYPTSFDTPPSQTDVHPIHNKMI